MLAKEGEGWSSSDYGGDVTQQKFLHRQHRCLSLKAIVSVPTRKTLNCDSLSEMTTHLSSKVIGPPISLRLDDQVRTEAYFQNFGIPKVDIEGILITMDSTTKSDGKPIGKEGDGLLSSFIISFASLGLDMLIFIYFHDFIDWDWFSWRKPLLGVLFPSEVLPNILAIHVPKDRKRDELLWEHTSNGQYTVKSGYFSAYVRSLGALSISGGFDGWRKLRSLKLPPKLTLFFWIVLHRILPVKARRFLENVQVGFLFLVGCPLSVLDWVAKWWSEASNKETIVESIYILWGIWCQRNQFVFSNVQDGIEVAVRNVSLGKVLLHGFWMVADDRDGTLKVYACSLFMVEAIAVLNRGWRSVAVLTDCL
ncbi:hypothetical protein RHSIM_RhsimUnG0145900 [Rhododendron simsii]|uniref:Reverse transcriptase zinc-binding domain-containing protein n=1 Tax=Rhododendron simsii TaxID=118357 RepID=A0A834L4M6_RHOSS|nr:hypothetical protein RHSIM_RhsimUnG0145900 [Rhododendron simsii]